MSSGPASFAWAGPYSLDELTTVRVAGYWGDGEASTRRPNRVHVVRNGDIGTDGSLRGSAIRFFSDRELAKATICPSDVLITTSGDVGKVCMPVEPRDLAVSNFVRLLRANPELTTGAFLRLLLEGPDVRRVLPEHTGGSTIPNLRRSFFETSFLRLPPPKVQRRIVDLIGAIDAAVETLVAEAAAASQAEGPLIHELLTRETEGVETVPLGETGEFVRGRRFTKNDYVPSGLGCIHYGQIHTHFGQVARRSLTFLPEASRSRLRLARPGDVVVAATSEDIDGLGKATVWLGDDDVAVHDDCYIFRHRLDPVFASYAFASPWFQQQKKQYAGGTKVTRISGADLARIAIPVPPIAVQVKVGEALSALDNLVNGVHVELDALRQLRASILTALLHRQVEIAEAYDLLMEAEVSS